MNGREYTSANAPQYVEDAACNYVMASNAEARGMGSASTMAARGHDRARIAFAQALRRWATEVEAPR